MAAERGTPFLVHAIGRSPLVGHYIVHCSGSCRVHSHPSACTLSAMSSRACSTNATGSVAIDSPTAGPETLARFLYNCALGLMPTLRSSGPHGKAPCRELLMPIIRPRQGASPFGAHSNVRPHAHLFPALGESLRSRIRASHGWHFGSSRVHHFMLRQLLRARSSDA